MFQINAKEARQRLSELLDIVEKGEEIEVTRRGHVVARWLPPKKITHQLPSLNEFRKSLGEIGTASAVIQREERNER